MTMAVESTAFGCSNHLCTKQPKLLQHKDKLHQQQHFAWWAQIKSDGWVLKQRLKDPPLGKG